MSGRGAVRAAAGVVAAALLLAGCGGDNLRATVLPGHTVPAYTAQDMDGQERTLQELRGSTVLLNAWATWCAPCRKEMPALQTLHETYGPRGLRIVGVSIDGAGQERAIEQFVEEFGATFTIWWDPDGTVLPRFGSAGIPTTYLIDREGTVLWRHLGPVRADDPELLRLLEETL